MFIYLNIPFHEIQKLVFNHVHDWLRWVLPSYTRKISASISALYLHTFIEPKFTLSFPPSSLEELLRSILLRLQAIFILPCHLPAEMKASKRPISKSLLSFKLLTLSKFSALPKLPIKCCQSNAAKAIRAVFCFYSNCVIL